MVANDSTETTRGERTGESPPLSSGELSERLDEEIARAERHHTALSCLLVSLQDMESLARSHGQGIVTQALDHTAAALGRQLRRFDRVGAPAEGELLVILPGADERHAEIVARRSLGRLHAVKVELDGRRRPLSLSVGIAAWRRPMGAQELMTSVRAAARVRRPS